MDSVIVLEPEEAAERVDIHLWLLGLFAAELVAIGVAGWWVCGIIAWVVQA